MCQNFCHAILGGLRPRLRRQPKRVFKQFPNGGVGPIAKPFANRCFPCIDDEARCLLGSGKRFEFRCFKPPWPAALEAMYRLSPQLISRLFEAVPVNHSLACDRPEAPRPGWVFQIPAHRRIDGPGENALPRLPDCMLAVGRAETIVATTQKRLDSR